MRVFVISAILAVSTLSGCGMMRMDHPSESKKDGITGYELDRSRHNDSVRNNERYSEGVKKYDECMQTNPRGMCEERKY